MGNKRWAMPTTSAPAPKPMQIIHCMGSRPTHEKRPLTYGISTIMIWTTMVIPTMERNHGFLCMPAHASTSFFSLRALISLKICICGRRLATEGRAREERGG